MFRVDLLSGLALTSEVFSDMRPDYDPVRDDKMVTIHCRVSGG